MSNFSLSYCNRVDKLTPFSSKEAAIAWLDKQGIDLSNTPIMLPFYHENGNIELLKPKNEDDSLRVIGAGNPERKTNFLSRLYRSTFSKLMGVTLIPHMNDIDGDIPIEKNGFVVVYQKDTTAPASKESIGNKFVELYEKEREDLIAQIKLTDTNDKPKVNESRFTENLSKLAIDLNIVAGMCYFIYKEEDGTESVYRHIFKEGVANRQIANYLTKEKESAQNGEKIAAPVQIQNNKTIRTHRIAFIKDLMINLSFLFFTTVIMAATAAAAITFLPLTPALIVIGITGVSLFAGIPSLYKKVAKKNQPTVEFGDKFETTLLSKYFKLGKGNFLSRIFSKLFSLGRKNTPIMTVAMDTTPEVTSTPALTTTAQSNITASTPANDATTPAVADVARTESTATPLTQQPKAEANTPVKHATNPAVHDVARYTNGALTRSIVASGILTRSTFAPLYYNAFTTTLLSKYFKLISETFLSRIFYSPFSSAFARKNTPAKNDVNPVVDNIERHASSAFARSTFAPLYNAAESIVSSMTAPLYAATGTFSNARSYFFSRPTNQSGTKNTPVSDNRLSSEPSLPAPSAKL